MSSLGSCLDSSACSMLSFGRAQPFSSPIRKGRVASFHQGRRQSSAFVSTMASLSLTGATVPCTLHLRCARSRMYIYIYEFVVQAPVGFCGLAAFTADGNSVSIACCYTLPPSVLVSNLREGPARAAGLESFDLDAADYRASISNCR